MSAVDWDKGIRVHSAGAWHRKGSVEIGRFLSLETAMKTFQEEEFNANRSGYENIRSAVYDGGFTMFGVDRIVLEFISKINRWKAFVSAKRQQLFKETQQVRGSDNNIVEVRCIDSTGIEDAFDKGVVYLAMPPRVGDEFLQVMNRFGEYTFQNWDRFDRFVSE